MSRRSVRVTTNRGRWYTDKDTRPYWSATTMLDVLPKPWMEDWATKLAAEYALSHHEEIGRMLRGGDHLAALESLVAGDLDQAVELLRAAKPQPRKAISMLKDGDIAGAMCRLLSISREDIRRKISGASRRYSRERMDVGSEVHEAIEAFVLGKPRPTITDPEIGAHMDRFGEFLRDFQPVFEASELTVFNRTESYAGTLDAIIHLDGDRWLLDIKTGKAVYPEVALQLAMYRHAEFFQLRDGEEHPVPETVGGLVLHLRADHCALVPVQCDEPIFKTALHAREIFRWQREISTGVVQDPLTPPALEMPDAD